MKAGYFVFNDEENRKVIWDEEFLMMEEFFIKHNIPFEKKQWNVNCWLFYDRQEMLDFKNKLIKAMLRKYHGSDDPRVVSAARNTSLFEPRGPVFGDY